MDYYKHSPCLDCKERFVGCHTLCLKYIEYKNILSEICTNKLKDEVVVKYKQSRK